MADFEHARAMLRMAHKDFNALTGMLDNALFADEIFGFHVQQAVKKALKAWLCTLINRGWIGANDFAEREGGAHLARRNGRLSPVSIPLDCGLCLVRCGSGYCAAI